MCSGTAETAECSGPATEVQLEPSEFSVQHDDGKDEGWDRYMCRKKKQTRSGDESLDQSINPTPSKRARRRKLITIDERCEREETGRWKSKGDSDEIAHTSLTSTPTPYRRS